MVQKVPENDQGRGEREGNARDEAMRMEKFTDGQRRLPPPYVCCQTGGLSNELREGDGDGEGARDATHW